MDVITMDMCIHTVVLMWNVMVVELVNSRNKWHVPNVVFVKTVSTGTAIETFALRNNNIPANIGGDFFVI